MNVLRLSVFLISLSSLPAFVETAATEPGFVSMFDGETLAGWEVTPNSAVDAWSVKNGLIMGEGKRGRSYLTYAKNRNVADFEMRFSYRLPGKGNTGVNIRSIVDETKTRGFQSYHADLGHVGIGANVLGAWDFHTPQRKEHGCPRGKRLVIDENDRGEYTNIENACTLGDINKGDWNDVRIVAKGNNFRLFVNNKLSAEFTEHLPKERRLHSGLIQLQLHDPGMVVHFKDLRIRVDR